MTSSIEKAAHRLEQLRNAGVVNLSNQEFLKKDTDISDTMLSDIESAKNKFKSAVAKWTVPADSLHIISQMEATCNIALAQCNW